MIDLFLLQLFPCNHLLFLTINLYSVKK